jgi:hypothetical protein
MADCSAARAQPGSLFGCTAAVGPGQEARVVFEIDAACCGALTSVARTLGCEPSIDPNCSNNADYRTVQVITFRETGRTPEPGLPTGALTSSLTSALLSASAEATQGTIALNGLHLGAVDSSGPRAFRFSGKPGQNRIEARLVSSPVQTLVWQFNFEEAPGFVPGSLVVESGAPTALGDKFIAFRLGGGSHSMARFRFSLAE